MGSNQSRPAAQAPKAQRVNRCPTCSSQLPPGSKQLHAQQQQREADATAGSQPQTAEQQTQQQQKQGQQHHHHGKHEPCVAHKVARADHEYAPPISGHSGTSTSSTPSEDTTITSSVISVPSTPSDASSDYGVDEQEMDEIDADNDYDVDVDMEDAEMEPAVVEQIEDRSNKMVIAHNTRSQKSKNGAGPVTQAADKSVTGQSKKNGHSSTERKSKSKSKSGSKKSSKAKQTAHSSNRPSEQDVFSLDEPVTEDSNNNEPEVDIDDILADADAESAESASEELSSLQARELRPRARGRTRRQPERRARRRAAILAARRMQASSLTSRRSSRRRPTRNSTYAIQ